MGTEVTIHGNGFYNPTLDSADKVMLSVSCLICNRRGVLNMEFMQSHAISCRFGHTSTDDADFQPGEYFSSFSGIYLPIWFTNSHSIIPTVAWTPATYVSSTAIKCLVPSATNSRSTDQGCVHILK